MQYSILSAPYPHTHGDTWQCILPPRLTKEACTHNECYKLPLLLENCGGVWPKECVKSEVCRLFLAFTSHFGSWCLFPWSSVWDFLQSVMKSLWKKTLNLFELFSWLVIWHASHREYNIIILLKKETMNIHCLHFLYGQPWKRRLLITKSLYACVTGRHQQLDEWLIFGKYHINITNWIITEICGGWCVRKSCWGDWK